MELWVKAKHVPRAEKMSFNLLEISMFSVKLLFVLITSNKLWQSRMCAELLHLMVIDFCF